MTPESTLDAIRRRRAESNSHLSLTESARIESVRRDIDYLLSIVDRLTIALRECNRQFVLVRQQQKEAQK